MEEDRARLVVAGVALAWIAYELVMAWILRESFTSRDWAALAGKLAYLAGLLAASLTGTPSAVKYAAITSVAMAGSVRATQGWLGYTWFTALVPALGFAASLYLYRAGDRLGGLGLAYNGLGLLYFFATLWGHAYQAPPETVWSDLVAFALGIILGGLLTNKYGRPWYHQVLIIGALIVLYSHGAV